MGTVAEHYRLTIRVCIPVRRFQRREGRDLRERLGLTAEQQTKLDAILAAQQTKGLQLAELVQQLNSYPPTKEEAAKQAEFDRKLHRR